MLQVPQAELEEDIQTTCSSLVTNEPLPEMEEVVRPSEPGCPFDSSDIK